LTSIAAEPVVGSQLEADVIAHYFNEHYRSVFSFRTVIPPEGWRYLTSGAQRCVFVSPSGMVYKIEYGDTCNRKEHEILTEHADKSWAPSVSLFETHWGPVVAMPFIDDSVDDEVMEEEQCWGMRDEMLSAEGSRLMREIEKVIGDLHEGNYRVVNGLPVIIDAGFAGDEV
jgi:hypothetical protein